MMRIIFMGGNQAGCIGLLTLKSLGHDVAVEASTKMVCDLAVSLKVPLFAEDLYPVGAPWDLMVSVHGRQIVPVKALDNFKYGGINLHPCLWKYPGKDPIGRFPEDERKQSRSQHPPVGVGAHIMTENVDAGPVIFEQFLDLGFHVDSETTRTEVYNFLYPWYADVLIQAIKKRCV